MNNKPMILSVIALAAVIVLGILQFTGGCKKSANAVPVQADSIKAAPGSIVYFDLERVAAEYDYANELGDATEKKIKGITDEVTRRGNQLQNQVNSFNSEYNKGNLTSFQAERKAKELQTKQQEFDAYYQQQQQIVAEERTVMLNKIGNAIMEYVQKLNEQKQYGLIITTQGVSTIAAGNAGLDITSEIIAGLNEEYVQKKAKGEIE
ncbi:MAG: OmpH family outer membrane protein [Bacteroidales bacterium]|nr:OmpH family outer membrane protein [Bacteroidales bacterium]MBQ2090778.1 OmpH family outer membrane protein [Bacteroidales bacterium]MBQ7468265.1 OmpH family outer membrane protein [Bacteroidales bacterium]MBQ8462347.1 OmpH family outer membrane protein [Bacteroidales bacterium]MDT3360896.1 OmpH family outer membrane protein [Bacteroidota bacterium]